ncbi:hypothetical protein [Arcobacter sp. FWKO B]|uniref:hypothetical protein n=1 Tax=Arcobacter sp. FWKO B TaxID=2593672 RepID=UPI0018A69A90|nr:hypothetical protein [Arcobacter sp. FWKO B]QOG11429.1 hypothetical protein FWKOB_01400 [Arcobacter sp. FWKO B]
MNYKNKLIEELKYIDLKPYIKESQMIREEMEISQKRFDKSVKEAFNELVALQIVQKEIKSNRSAFTPQQQKEVAKLSNMEVDLDKSLNQLTQTFQKTIKNIERSYFRDFEDL